MVNLVNFMAQATSTTTDFYEDSSRSGGSLETLVVIVVYLGIYAFTSYLLGRIFAKAGEKPWKAWVPIYNTWMIFKLGGYSPWMVFIPFVNVIVYLAAHYKIGKNLGKSGWFLLLALFLYPVWLAWLALDNSAWTGNEAPAQPTAPDQNQPTVPPQFQ